ncbi:MAG TPA: DciA family protein [Pyrinomonadaceae bacterium]|nr:DciA family protein [Pyrinomonadaceae bacterium]
MPKLLRAAGEAEEVVEAAALVAWRRVAGEALRGCAVPFRLYRKTLIVAVPDTTWQKQLEAVSGQLLFRVNSMLGQALVTYIEFRVDQQTVREERARLQLSNADRTVQERRALERAGELNAAASAIRDDELRRRFLLAAGSYIEAHNLKS